MQRRALHGDTDDASLAVLFGDMFVQPELRPPEGLSPAALATALSNVMTPKPRSRSVILLNNL